MVLSAIPAQTAPVFSDVGSLCHISAKPRYQCPKILTSTGMERPMLVVYFLSREVTSQCTKEVTSGNPVSNGPLYKAMAGAAILKVMFGGEILYFWIVLAQTT